MASEPRFDIYKDVAGQWRWTFFAANGLKIADSAEGYNAQRDCLHGLMIVKAHAGKAKVNGVISPSAEAVARALMARRRPSMLG